MISRTDPEREIYEARLKARRDAAYEQYAAREEGLKEGLAEGRAEGRAEALRNSIRALQKALRRSVTPLEELQSLALDELESIWAGLADDGN